MHYVLGVDKESRSRYIGGVSSPSPRYCRRVAKIKGSPSYITLYARTMHPPSSLMAMFTVPRPVI